jgi:hypothetical protein
MIKYSEVDEHLYAYAKQQNLYGVEAIRNPLRNDPFWGDTAFIYADARDPYTPTLCYDVQRERFITVCFADMAEENNRYRRFIGQAYDLLESFCFGFLYETDGKWEKAHHTEILVTVLNRDSMTVDYSYVNKPDLLTFIKEVDNKDFHEQTGRDIEDYETLTTVEIFEDLFEYFGPVELQITDGTSDFDNWIAYNTQYSNLDFDVYSVVMTLNGKH